MKKEVLLSTFRKLYYPFFPLYIPLRIREYALKVTIWVTWSFFFLSFILLIVSQILPRNNTFSKCSPGTQLILWFLSQSSDFSPSPVINPPVGLQTLCSGINTTAATPFSRSSISLILPILITLFTWKKYQHHGWFHWAYLYNNKTLFNSLKRPNTF